MSGLVFYDYKMQLHSVGDRGVTFQVARQGVTGTKQYNAWQSDEGRYIIMERDVADSSDITNKYYYGSVKTSFDTDWTNRATLTYGEYYEIFDDLA